MVTDLLYASNLIKFQVELMHVGENVKVGNTFVRIGSGRFVIATFRLKTEFNFWSNICFSWKLELMVHWKSCTSYFTAKNKSSNKYVFGWKIVWPYKFSAENYVLYICVESPIEGLWHIWIQNIVFHPARSTPYIVHQPVCLPPWTVRHTAREEHSLFFPEVSLMLINKKTRFLFNIYVKKCSGRFICIFICRFLPCKLFNVRKDYVKVIYLKIMTIHEDYAKVAEKYKLHWTIFFQIEKTSSGNQSLQYTKHYLPKTLWVQIESITRHAYIFIPPLLG